MIAFASALKSSFSERVRSQFRPAALHDEGLDEQRIDAEEQSAVVPELGFRIRTVQGGAEGQAGRKRVEVELLHRLHPLLS